MLAMFFLALIGVAAALEAISIPPSQYWYGTRATFF